MTFNFSFDDNQLMDNLLASTRVCGRYLDENLNVQDIGASTIANDNNANGKKTPENDETNISEMYSMIASLQQQMSSLQKHNIEMAKRLALRNEELPHREKLDESTQTGEGGIRFQFDEYFKSKSAASNIFLVS